MCKDAVVSFIPNQINKQGKGRTSHSLRKLFSPTIETAYGTGKCRHRPVDS